jgi:hypothetical protein
VLARRERQREEEERTDAARRERIARLLDDLTTLSHSDRESLVERLPSHEAQALLQAAGHLGKGGPSFFLTLARDSLVKWQTGSRKDWTLSLEVEDVMRRVGAENTVPEERSQ